MKLRLNKNMRLIKKITLIFKYINKMDVNREAGYFLSL